MKNIKTKEISVSNLNEFLEVIKKELIKCKDTQFFISNALYTRFLIENKKCIIWSESVSNSFQYCDNVEKAFILQIKNNNETKTVQMHFVSYCIDYMNLTFFFSKGILYHQYLSGMKNIIIITTD